MIQTNESALIKVWDLPTRIFHWLLVCLFSFLVISGELGNDWMRWHMLAGYSLSGMILFRIFWGFVGTHHARFSNFVRTPRTTITYLLNMIKGEEKHYAGHNPAGAIMVLLLLIALTLQALTGLVTTDDVLWNGPFYNWVPDDIAELGGSIHRLLEVGLKLMVAAHIVAIIVHKFHFKEPLIAAMIHGRKPLPLVGVAQIDTRDSMLVIGMVVSVGWVGWLWSLPI